MWANPGQPCSWVHSGPIRTFCAALCSLCRWSCIILIQGRLNLDLVARDGLTCNSYSLIAYELLNHVRPCLGPSGLLVPVRPSKDRHCEIGPIWIGFVRPFAPCAAGA